jgi:hypothetical protein
MLWETGEITWEPITRKDKTGVYDTDPVTLSTQLRIIYSTPQDGNYQDYANSPQKRLLRLANQAKLHSFRTKPVYMYGYLVPRNHEQALELDKTNGNTRWADATDKELVEINEYDTFSDKGKVIVQDKITRRSEYILYMRSSTTDVTRHA